MDPVPTPFDITPIPVFAFTPGVIAWITVIGSALLILLILKLFEKRILSRKSKGSAAIESAIKELEALLGRELLDPKAALSSAQRTVRLAIAVSEPPFNGIHPTEMSSKELSEWQQSAAAPLGKILEQIIGIESEVYSGSAITTEKAVSEIKLLKSTLSSYGSNLELRSTTPKRSV